MIKFMGTKKNETGAVLYVFIINGLLKEVRETALKQHPGCYDALPQATKQKISSNRAWMSKMARDE